MKSFRIGIVAGTLTLLPLAAFSAGRSPATEGSAKPEPRGGGFSLLPKSLQKNPRLDFNIFTEMTAQGRRLAQPTPEKPAYYVAQAGKMVNTGIGAESLKGPPPEHLQRLMDRALAEGGYRPSEGSGQPPTLAIVYHWGSSSFQPPEEIPGETADDGTVTPPTESVSQMDIRKALLTRASLLGGVSFVREVSLAMQQVDQKASAQRSFAAPEGGSFMGSVGDMMRDPFDELRSRNVEMERLVDELFSSSYFVIASAYDYAALAKGQRQLLWRTKMTVNSLGVNMNESVLPLIASAAPYLGRETKEPVVVSKRVNREGRVEIGTATVVEPAPASATKDATPAPKK